MKEFNIRKLLSMLTAIGIATTLSAQNGQFDVRFSVKNVDCAANKVTILVQVKARDGAHTFKMGDANYRFDYDPRQIANPSIVSQENFSNRVPSSDLNYGPQNLNGSSAGPTVGTVSLNTIYTGSAESAKDVSTSWMTVSAIQFDIINATACFNLIWHDDQTFPVTGMNEVVPRAGAVFEYDLYIVAAGGYFGNSNVCIPNICTPMIAMNDINTTIKNIPVIGSFLTNDISSSAMTITTTPIFAPANGTIVINANGMYTYTPNTGFLGEDSVKYQVCNAQGICDTAILKINILNNPPNGPGNDAPIANDDVVTTFQGVTVTGNIKANDIDPDGNTLTLNPTPVTAPLHGALTLNPDGTFTFIPENGFYGTDIFKYQVCDNGTPSKCDTATVVIEVLLDNNGTGNDKPFAGDDAFGTNASTAITASLAPNDFDPNAGAVLTYNTTPITAPAHGTVTINANGTFTYTPTAGYIGSDRFVYLVCDNGSPSLCDSATAVVTMYALPNLPPVVVKSPIVTAEDSTTTTCFAITDPDAGDTHTVTPCGLLHGTVTTTINNITHQLCVTYTPTLNYNGLDTICLIVCDNALISMCDTAKIPVSVAPRNDKAVVNITPPMIAEDTTITFCGAIVDADIADTHTVTPCGVQHGTATATVNNVSHQLCITYSPTPNYNGADTICLIVCDNGSPSLCDTLKVPLVISPRNDKPVIADALINTPGDTTKTYCLPITDPDVTDTHTVSVCGAPTQGTQVGTINNATHELCVQYTPNLGFTGRDSICYIVCDNQGGCDTLKVVFNVTQNNRAPNAMNDINNTIKNMPTTGNVLVNDRDQDNNIMIVNTTPIQAPANGTFVLNANGNYTYTPNPTFIGTEIIRYAVCDNGAPSRCDTATLVIEVRSPYSVAGTNTPPVINDDNTSTPVGQSIILNVKANDFDPQGGTIGNPTLVGATVGGTPMVNGDGTITFVPTPGFIGDASFRYAICDNGTPQACDTATVMIVVYNTQGLGANLPPTAADDANTTFKNTTLNGTVAANDLDPNAGQSLTYALVTSTAHGTITLSFNGSYIYTPTSGYVGPDQFRYLVCDNGSPVKCDTATVFLTIFDFPCFTLELKAILEGCFDTIGGRMKTTLNQRGLLPGQTPIGQFAVATAAGHPYKVSPWSFMDTTGNSIRTYAATVVDWVLVSLRTDQISVASEVYKAAGWLHSDGTITFINPCLSLDPTKQYYVMVEHRNHMGVLSSNSVAVVNGKLTFDFTAQNGYVRGNPPTTAQKYKGGKYVLLAADGKKDSQNTNFDINFQDSQYWKAESGIFDRYMYTDFNLDADINFQDAYLWKLNTGKYSGVPH
jgi:hypothetical protein